MVANGDTRRCGVLCLRRRIRCPRRSVCFRFDAGDLESIGLCSLCRRFRGSYRLRARTLAYFTSNHGIPRLHRRRPGRFCFGGQREYSWIQSWLKQQAATGPCARCLAGDNCHPGICGCVGRGGRTRPATTEHLVAPNLRLATIYPHSHHLVFIIWETPAKHIPGPLFPATFLAVFS